MASTLKSCIEKREGRFFFQKNRFFRAKIWVEFECKYMKVGIRLLLAILCVYSIDRAFFLGLQPEKSEFVELLFLYLVPISNRFFFNQKLEQIFYWLKKFNKCIIACAWPQGTSDISDRRFRHIKVRWCQNVFEESSIFQSTSENCLIDFCPGRFYRLGTCDLFWLFSKP